MKKYITTISNTLQNSLAYRSSFLITQFRDILDIVVKISLWLFIFKDRTTLYSYGLNDIISYTVLEFVLSSIVFTSTTYSLAGEINSGTLSNLILKPINPFLYYFSSDIAIKTTKMISIPFSLLIIKLLFNVSMSSIGIIRFLQFLLYTSIAVITFFHISFIFGAIGFWSREVWAPRFLFFILLSFASGSVFPLDMLPQSWSTALKFNPFAHILFFPLKTYIGQLDNFWQHISIATAWAIFFYLLSHAIWRKGMKKYNAEGL